MSTTLPIDLLASSDLGSSNTDNLTNDDTPTLAGFVGVALFGATVDFTSDLDGALGSTTVGADGIWQMTLPQISQGNNWITATITAPDTSVTTETIKLGIDTYAVISIDEPIGVINQAFTLSGTSVGVENGRVVTIVLTDSNNETVELNATVSAGAWQVYVSEGSFNALDLGAVSIDVSASDRAGNIAQANKVVDFDMPPTITIDQPVADNGVINGAFTLSGTVLGVPNNALVTVILDGVSYRTVELTTRVSSGVWQVYVGEENFNGDKLLMGYLSIDVSAGGAETTVLSGISGINLLTSSDSGIQPPYNGHKGDDITNDDTPTIEGYIGYSGSEAIGVTVDLTSSLDGALGSTTVGTNGYWEITLPQLSEGDNEITATITTPDASVTTNTIELNIDTSAAITIDQPAFNEGVTVGAFTVSGTAAGVDDGQVVTVVLTDGDSKTVELTTTVLAEAWSVDISQANFKALDLGLVTIDASVNDIAANMSQASSSVYFTGINLLASSDLGVSNTDNLTSDDTPTIEGNAGLAAAGFTVDLSSDLDGALGSTTVDVDGYWQMTLPQLSQGNNWITATIIAPDTTVTTETIKLGIDTYAAITIDESTISNGPIESDFTLAGTVVGVEDGSRRVTVTFTDQEGNVASNYTNVSAGQWSMDINLDQTWSGTIGGIPVMGLAGIKAGVVDVTVSAVDRAGNAATDTSSMARAGINLPASSDTGVSDTDNLTNDTTPIIEGYTHSDFIGGLVELSSSIDGVIGSTTVDANGYWQVTTAELAQDNHTITATITAINSTVITNTLALGIDTYAVITIDAPVVTTEGLVFAGTVLGVENGQEVTLTLTDSNSNTETVNAVITDFKWQVLANTIPPSLLAGDITIDAQVSDRAGNITTDSLVANVPLALLGDNILAAVQMANGESAVLFDEATGFTVQHFDAALNPSTAPVHLAALNVVGEFVFEVINTVTGHYSLNSEINGKEWVFDSSGILLTESEAADIPRTVDTTSLYAADDGFVNIEQYVDVISPPGGTSTGGYTQYESILDMSFYDPDGFHLYTKSISYTYGSSGIFSPYGSTIEGSELTSLPNGDILIVMHIKPYAIVSTADEFYKAFIFDINGNAVNQIASFDVGLGQPSDNFSLSADDTSFTLTTGIFYSTTISYASIYPPESPTVNDIDTSNTHPWLSGTFDADDTETLTVAVDGKTYMLGEDSNLYQHTNNDNAWVLKPQGFYHLGEHDVVVTATGSNGVSAVDTTTGELTISRDMFAPRVNLPKQIYNKRPAVGGTFDEAATETLTVELDGTVYTLGVDAELSNHLNNKWVLNLSTLETPLSDGVYDVIVNTTDANSVTLQDASTGELTIGMLAPTVYELESTNFKPVLRGFYDADFGDGLVVTVNGDTYTLGVDSQLTTHASNDNLWVLRPSNALNFGNNDIQVVATDTKGKDKTDITSDEIHIYQTKSQAVHGDVLITQAGDDIITINDNTFNQIDAGAGVDTLSLDGDAISLNFANIQSIDVVDLNDATSTANTLTLTLEDVLTKTDNSSLSILGDSADTVTLATADSWIANGSQVIDGVTFDGYDSGAASLLIEQGVVVQMV